MSVTELDRLLTQRFGPKVRRGAALNLRPRCPEIKSNSYFKYGDNTGRMRA